jgi:hypothetical protein
MPNIRDLGISSIPATARPLEMGNGGSDPITPTTQANCCNPTNYPPDCNPTNRPPGCQPTNPPGCEATNPPNCNPTNYPPNCNPTNRPPGCQPTNKPHGDKEDEGGGGYSAIPPEAIAQLKRQLHQHISREPQT